MGGCIDMTIGGRTYKDSHCSSKSSYPSSRDHGGGHGHSSSGSRSYTDKHPAHNANINGYGYLNEDLYERYFDYSFDFDQPFTRGLLETSRANFRDGIFLWRDVAITQVILFFTPGVTTWSDRNAFLSKWRYKEVIFQEANKQCAQTSGVISNIDFSNASQELKDRVNKITQDIQLIQSLKPNYILFDSLPGAVTRSLNPEIRVEELPKYKILNDVVKLYGLLQDMRKLEVDALKFKEEDTALRQAQAEQKAREEAELQAKLEEEIKQKAQIEEGTKTLLDKLLHNSGYPNPLLYDTTELYKTYQDMKTFSIGSEEYNNAQYKLGKIKEEIRRKDIIQHAEQFQKQKNDIPISEVLSGVKGMASTVLVEYAVFQLCKCPNIYLTVAGAFLGVSYAVYEAASLAELIQNIATIQQEEREFLKILNEEELKLYNNIQLQNYE